MNSDDSDCYDFRQTTTQSMIYTLSDCYINSDCIMDDDDDVENMSTLKTTVTLSPSITTTTMTTTMTTTTTTTTSQILSSTPSIPLFEQKFKYETTDDTDDSETPIPSSSSSLRLSPPPRKRVKKERTKVLKIDDYLAVASQNIPLYLAVISTTSDEMVRIACQNCFNHNNIQLLEWSEAVLIQLCTLKTCINFQLYTWKQLLDFVENNQWAVEVTQSIKDYINSSTTLARIITENHNVKINKYHMNPIAAFVSIPSINYKLLSRFKLTTDSIIKPISSFRQLPMKVKKKK